MKVYLCRHGETTGDVEDRYGGDYEDHLTDKGKKQSNELANELVGRKIEIIYTSPRIRARETAKILQERLNCPVESVEGIRERNHYGILTGMVKSEARKRYPKLVELLRDYHNTIKGAEAYRPFLKRVSLALNKLAKSDHKTIAIVTHGGPIRVIFREILNQGEIDIEDCAFAELENIGGRWKILRLKGIKPQN